MARRLIDQTGVVADADYLDGKLVNGTTVVGEGINQDIVQFFEYLKRILDMSGTQINGLPDNEVNGYQTILGLHEYIKSLLATTSYAGVVRKATSAEVLAGTADRFVDAALLLGAIASEAQAKALTANKLIDGVAAGHITGGLITKVVEIGAWDMTSTDEITVLHGLDYTKIRNVIVSISDDGQVRRIMVGNSNLSGTYQAESNGTAYVYLNSVYIKRTANSIFNTSDYNSTSINRGWITIQYVP